MILIQVPETFKEWDWNPTSKSRSCIQICSYIRDVFRGPARPGLTNVIGPGRAGLWLGTVSEQFRNNENVYC